jgi:hypothetical protein
MSIEREKESERVVGRKVVEYVSGDLLFVRRVRVIKLAGSQVSPFALRQFCVNIIELNSGSCWSLGIRSKCLKPIFIPFCKTLFCY